MARSLKRYVILSLGWFFVFLGILGLFLPILQGILSELQSLKTNEGRSRSSAFTHLLPTVLAMLYSVRTILTRA